VPRNASYARTAGLIAVALSTLLGCKERQIRAYPAPKDESAAPSAMPTAMPTAPETVSWTLPPGWREFPGEGLRFATVLLEDAADDGSRPPLEMRVTPLGMAARDPLANVNRWRTQIGLEPIGPEQLGDVSRVIQVDGRSVHLVEMVGAAGENEPVHQILAAIVPGDERVWFFMVLDHADRVAKHVNAFETFITSVRVHPAQIADATQMPAGHPPVTSRPDASAPANAGHAADAEAAVAAGHAAGIHWETPDGWNGHPGNSSFRVASFDVGTEPAAAEVTITRFAGGAGALLPNINRWRGQLGLDPIGAVSEQTLESIVVGNDQGRLLDLSDQNAADPGRARMLVLLLERGDTVWFVKMTGPHDVLEAQRSVFIAFTKSLQFETEQS